MSDGASTGGMPLLGVPLRGTRPWVSMTGGVVVKSLSTRRLAGILLAVAVLGSTVWLLPARAAPGPPAAPPTSNAKPPGMPMPPTAAPPAEVAPPAVLRYSRNVPGEAKPLILNADKFITWVEKGHRVILMRGQVLIQQGVIRLRCQEAVALVNLDRLQRQGILHADLYAEGDVFLEDGRSDRKAAVACIDLNTRGELKILAQKQRVGQEPAPKADVFQRALKELYGIGVAGTPRPAGTEEPADRRAPGPSAPPPPPGYAPMPPPAPKVPPGKP